MKHYSKGYCRVHYWRARKGLAMDAPFTPRTAYNAFAKCLILDCERDYYGAGACGKHYQLLRGHSLTVIQLQAILSTAACEICEAPLNGVLHIDHDHSCCIATPNCAECNRGVLCPQCNVAIGIIRNDPKTARKAAKYLGFGV